MKSQVGRNPTRHNIHLSCYHCLLKNITHDDAVNMLEHLGEFVSTFKPENIFHNNQLSSNPWSKFAAIILPVDNDKDEHIACVLLGNTKNTWQSSKIMYMDHRQTTCNHWKRPPSNKQFIHR